MARFRSEKMDSSNNPPNYSEVAPKSEKVAPKREKVAPTPKTGTDTYRRPSSATENNPKVIYVSGMKKHDTQGVEFVNMVFLFDENYTVRDAINHAYELSTDEKFRSHFRGYSAYKANGARLNWIPDLGVNVHKIIDPGTQLVICPDENAHELYAMGYEYYLETKAKLDRI